jgi:hypothetical protein
MTRSEALEAMAHWIFIATAADDVLSKSAAQAALQALEEGGVLLSFEEDSSSQDLAQSTTVAPPYGLAGPEPFEVMHAGEDGWCDWVHPAPGYLMQCCDCGLIHEMQFQIFVRDEELRGGPLNEGEDEDTGVIVFRAKRADDPQSSGAEGWP